MIRILNLSPGEWQDPNLREKENVSTLWGLRETMGEGFLRAAVLVRKMLIIFRKP